MPKGEDSEGADKHAQEAKKSLLDELKQIKKRADAASKKGGSASKKLLKQIHLEIYQKPVIVSLRTRISSIVDFERELKQSVLGEYKNFRRICQDIADRLKDKNPSTAVFPGPKELKSDENDLRQSIKEKEAESKSIKGEVDELEKLIKEETKKLEELIKDGTDKEDDEVKKLSEQVEEKKKKLIERDIEKDKINEAKKEVENELGEIQKQQKSSQDSGKLVNEYSNAVKGVDQIQGRITGYIGNVGNDTKKLKQEEKGVLDTIKKKADVDKYLKKIEADSKAFYKNKRQFYYDYEHLSQDVFSAIIKINEALGGNYGKVMPKKDYKALVRLQAKLRRKKKELMKEEKDLNAQTQKVISEISKQSSQVSKEIGQ